MKTGDEVDSEKQRYDCVTRFALQNTMPHSNLGLWKIVYKDARRETLPNFRI
jgi:hypothetical protein